MLGIILLACITDYKTEKTELDQYVDTTGGITSGGSTNGGTTGGNGNDVDSDGDGYQIVKKCKLLWIKQPSRRKYR